MPAIRVPAAAEILGVSDDTVRRWITQGKLASRVESGRLVVDGVELAAFAAAAGRSPHPTSDRRRDTTQNRFLGIATKLTGEGPVIRLEVQAGQHRFVSVISRDTAQRLSLEPGAPVVVRVNATDVGVERPIPGKRRRAVHASKQA